MDRRARALPVLVLLGLLAALALPQPCLACSCMTDDPRVHAAYADVIFRGRVVEVQDMPGWRWLLPWNWDDLGPHRTEARLRADAVWKGAPEPEYLVKGGDGGGDCTITFTVGAEYIIYGQARGDEALDTNTCLGTISTDHRMEAAQTLADLGPATPVAAPVLSSAIAGSEASDRLVPLLLLAGAFGLATVGALAAWHRRSRPRRGID